MFARHVFTMVFTISLAERFYNVFRLFSFYKYLFHLNSRFLHYVSPFSFYSFYNVHTQGKAGVAGSPLFICYEFLFFFLSLSASNWDYLYYSLLRQGISFILMGKGGVTGFTFIISHQRRG